MGRLRQSTETIQRILDESDGLREFTERELNTLKGEGEGSIKQALNEVLGGASEAYDTLKEIEDYIEKDEAGAVALTQSIARLETEKVSKEDIDSALSTESENPVQNKVITVALNEKVDKVSGKGLSTNDYTTSEKDKLASLENYDDSVIRTSLEEVETQIESQDALIKDLQDGKANKEGNYPSLRVGTADTAIDLAGRGESVPAEFGFRASGGKSIKDGRAYIKRIKGNSVVWNQKLNNAYQASGIGGWHVRQGQDKAEFLDNSVTWSFESGVSSAPELTQFAGFTKGHKYLIVTEYKLNLVDGGKKFYLILRQTAGPANSNIVSLGPIGATANQGTVSIFFESQYDDKPYLNVYPYNITNDIGESATLTKARVIDLTKMFQAGNEPTTIEDFNARVATLGVDMNAYNEGEVIHCNTESIKSVGDNAWDEQWEKGTIVDNTGALVNSETTIRSKNYIKVIGGQEYRFAYFGSAVTWGRLFYYDSDKALLYSDAMDVNKNFTLPSNCAYIKFRMGDNYGVIYNHDITISLYHSGWKAEVDNTYKPYWQDTLPLPIISKYFPDGMKSAGSAHDEIRYNKASGKWEYSKGRIKSVDLGTLNWKNLDASNGMFWLSRQEVIDLNMATHDNENIPTNLISSLYASAPTYNIVNIDKVFRGPFTTKFSGDLTVKDTAYTDAATFKAAMAGVMLYYESNDWEWVALDEADQNFRDYYNVADFGTEMSQSNVPSAPFSADIIYQFNAVDMIREHELEITELQSIITEQQSVIATMQAQLTSLTNGGQ